jgi:hypothetical protein
MKAAAGMSGGTASAGRAGNSAAASAGTSGGPGAPGGTQAGAGATQTPPADGSGSAAGNALTGMLGALGDVKPVMAGWATTNGLETLLYLSSSPLTCAMMMTKGTKWLASLPAGTQVIEIVVRGGAAAQTYPIGMLMGEVNYAEGSKSSSTEVTGKTGSITFTKADAKGVHEGMVSVTAPFTLSGMFHAQWCEGGTEY